MRMGTGKFLSFSLIALILLMVVACGTAATPTAAPPAAPSGPETGNTGPAPTAGPTATPTVAPTVTPLSTQVTSAKDSMTLVIDSEPAVINPLGTVGSGFASAVMKDNLVDPLTWQSGDDLRIVPTTATVSWENTAPDTWLFHLRPGVKFHNGEPWNAQAALPLLDFQGKTGNDNSSFGYTGGYKASAVDNSTIQIKCDQACPVFPYTAFFLNFEAPKWYTNASEDELARNIISFGPYKLAKWEPGVSITEDAYEDYVPAGDHFEFQKPKVQHLTWLWRGEQAVQAAMVKAGEADIAWDVGVDNIGSLGEDQIKSGGSAETFVLRMNTLWHPELKKLKVRQAIAHAVNCQEIVDTLYGGHSRCWGNIIWPGVVGATEENTAPYTYDPDLSRQLLQEANYDSNNVITITGRGTRIPKNVEVYEATQGYLEEVGMNVEINVVEVSVWRTMRACGIGAALNEVLQASGRDPAKDVPTREDMQTAVNSGGASCPVGDMMDDEPSNETLDFARQANYYMNCTRLQSLFCDPYPGGVQDKLGPALAASGEERQRLLQELADIHHDQIPHLPGFETPVIYAVNPKLVWEPRFDRRVRASAMWFNP
jgi:peptide/nickel transport system substrate-binding protein